MRIEIEIPTEFEENFAKDRFEESLHRLSADAHMTAGKYEQETAIMLIEAFKNAKSAYDTDNVVEELKELAIEFELFGQSSDYVELTHAIDIVKGGWDR